MSNIPSNATIKSFATGYNTTNAIINNVVMTAAVTKAGAAEVVTIAGSFFAGIKFAINERRGTKPVVPTEDLATQAAALKAKRLAALKANIEIFNRGNEEPVTMKRRSVA
jgi:hypothetical protein